MLGKPFSLGIDTETGHTAPCQTVFEQEVEPVDTRQFPTGHFACVPVQDMGHVIGYGLIRKTGPDVWDIGGVAGDDARPDVDVSIIQPIFNYSLGDGWSVGTSEMTFTYDWNRNEFISLPLGVKVSKLTTIGGQKVQFTGSYERNFYDEAVAVEDTVQFIVKLLVPK